MFFEYQNNTYCVNCDWLQYSVTLTEGEAPELICPEGFRLELLPGNNIFRNRAILTRCDDGAKYLTLLWSPYSKLIKSNIMTVQVANYCLYAGGIHGADRLLHEIVDCAFNALGRVDVCCDFVARDYELMRIRQMWSGDAYVARKSEGSSFWHAADGGNGRFPHCLSWGSKSSEIRVKLYNKSREIGVTPNGSCEDKPYILGEWLSAGMDVQRVWRLEFSLNSTGQLRWDGRLITLDDVADCGYLWRLFANLYEFRFDTRINAGRRIGHKNLDPKFALLTLPHSPDALRWAAPDPDKLAPSESITLLRRMVSSLDFAILQSSRMVYESVADVILRLCDDTRVYNYFRGHYGDEPATWLQRRYADVGEGIVHDVPNLARDYS